MFINYNNKDIDNIKLKYVNHSNKKNIYNFNKLSSNNKIEEDVNLIEDNLIVQNYKTIFKKSEFNNHKKHKVLKSFFKNLFPNLKNEKPGVNLYFCYNLTLMIIIFYAIVFYSYLDRSNSVNILADKDNSASNISINLTILSGNMVLFVLLHIVIIIFERYILIISDNSKNCRTKYKIYDILKGKELSLDNIKDKDLVKNNKISLTYLGKESIDEEALSNNNNNADNRYVDIEIDENNNNYKNSMVYSNEENNNNNNNDLFYDEYIKANEFDNINEESSSENNTLNSSYDNNLSNNNHYNVIDALKENVSDNSQISNSISKKSSFKSYIKHQDSTVSENFIGYNSVLINNKYSIKSNVSSKNEDKISKKNNDKVNSNYKLVSFYYSNSNYSLKLKYILLVIMTIFVNVFIFIYLPMQGNYNLNNEYFCQKNNGIEVKKCNSFQENTFIIILYILYIIYLLCSAFQIKYGFPELNNHKLVFMKSYSLINLYTFIAFKSIPFVFELSILIDYSFSNTALEIAKWFKIEAINNKLFEAKCLNLDERSKKVGTRIHCSIRFFKGLIAIGIIFIIFIPLFLFSNLNPVTMPNLVEDMSIELDLIVTKRNIFDSNSSVENNIDDFHQYEKSFPILRLNKNYIKSLSLKEFNYLNYDKNIYTRNTDFNNGQIINISTHGSVWNVSKEIHKNIIKDLNDAIKSASDINNSDYKLSKLLNLKY